MLLGQSCFFKLVGTAICIDWPSFNISTLDMFIDNFQHVLNLANVLPGAFIVPFASLMKHLKRFMRPSSSRQRHIWLSLDQTPIVLVAGTVHCLIHNFTGIPLETTNFLLEYIALLFFLLCFFCCFISAISEFLPFSHFLLHLV